LDFSNRLLFYYSPSKINSALEQGKSYICSAIIKYGLNNFSLEILEYCEPDKLLIREKYYIDLGSEYNIIKDPTLPTMSGRQHPDKSKQIMSPTRILGAFGWMLKKVNQEPKDQEKPLNK